MEQVTPEPDSETPEPQPEPEPEAPPPECQLFEPDEPFPELVPIGTEPVDVWLCPTDKTFESKVDARDTRTLAETPTPNSFVDPMPERESLAIYNNAIRRIARGAWIVPILLDGTPPLGRDQIELLESNKKLSAAFESIWTSKAGGVGELYGWGGGHKWRKFAPYMKRYKRDKHLIRALLLRDGMLYVEDPRAAADIYRFTRLTDLFDEPEIFLRRGDAVHKLIRRDRWTYVFAEGAREGERARLLVFDRMALSKEALSKRVGWDLNRLRPTAALKAFRIEDAGLDLLKGKAVLRDGDEIDGAAFEVDGQLTMVLAVSEDDREKTAARLNEDRRSAAVWRGIQMAGERMVGEELRFDEPKTEEGQQDGMLRRRWEYAYARGAHSYEFNGDRYRVYTRRGRPDVPQVCIDFVYDTFERWSGTWWEDKGEGRQRMEGFLNFDAIFGRVARRQVAQLVKQAERRDDMFEVVVYNEDERIPYVQRKRFYARLDELAETTMPGDIFSIYGKKTDGRNHWHSFLVHDVDPVYHFPYLLIGNAGRARIAVWHDTMRSGPLRSITHRVRLKESWLLGQKKAWEGAKLER